MYLQILPLGPVVPKQLCSVVSLNRKRRQDPPLLAPLPVTRTRPLAPSLVDPCSKTRSPGTAHSARRVERPGSSREVSMVGVGVDFWDVGLVSVICLVENSHEKMRCPSLKKVCIE